MVLRILIETFLRTKDRLVPNIIDTVKAILFYVIIVSQGIIIKRELQVNKLLVILHIFMPADIFSIFKTAAPCCFRPITTATLRFVYNSWVYLFSKLFVFFFLKQVIKLLAPFHVYLQKVGSNSCVTCACDTFHPRIRSFEPKLSPIHFRYDQDCEKRTLVGLTHSVSNWLNQTEFIYC